MFCSSSLQAIISVPLDEVVLDITNIDRLFGSDSGKYSGEQIVSYKNSTSSGNHVKD